MRINNNLMAMNTHRQLGTANTDSAKSIEKLSSGYRINRAGDDAAGLAISEKMRAQVRGLNQASANSQDGISMIQTAEGALTETHAILQRMRELSVQSANDTNVDVDRAEIQKEMNQLTSEINRIGNTTEFNTQKILKGAETASETNSALKLDATGTLAAPSETTGGATIPATGAQLELTTVVDGGAGASNGKSITFNLQGQEIKVNFNATGAAADPTVNEDGTEVTVNFLSTATVTADDKATAIKAALEAAIGKNANISADDFEIEAGTAKLTITSTAKGAERFINATAADTTEIAAGGTGIGTDVSYTASSVNVTFAAIADIADLPGQGITINGQSIEFYDADKGAYEGNADFSVNVSSVGDKDELAAAIVKQLGSKLDGVKLSAGTAPGDVMVTSTANGAEGDGIVIADGVDVAAKTSSETFTSKFQVGANSGQSMEINIGDMRSLAIGVSGNEAGATATAKNGTEASYVKTTNVNNGTDSTSVEYALDISSHDKAQAATSIINDAIEKVSAQRSDLGAFQNRLEHTIKNLDNTAENLQAAESRIRDVDMAKEMMEQTKQNILAQASTAMLAQANQAPQAVLQLLR